MRGWIKEWGGQSVMSLKEKHPRKERPLAIKDEKVAGK